VNVNYSFVTGPSVSYRRFFKLLIILTLIDKFTILLFTRYFLISVTIFFLLRHTYTYGMRQNAVAHPCSKETSPDNCNLFEGKKCGCFFCNEICAAQSNTHEGVLSWYAVASWGGGGFC
jgi:hypothetical protein